MNAHAIRWSYLHLPHSVSALIFAMNGLTLNNDQVIGFIQLNGKLLPIYEPPAACLTLAPRPPLPDSVRLRLGGTPALRTH